jgi:hypothetical protein
MAAITQHSKIRVKRSTVSGVIPTIGTTNDHTDGSWTNTDIYVGEYFYNVVDNRLWIGKLGGVQEIITAQLFELTYAEADLQKTIVGSPSGDGLIIGAKYKITDKGDAGIILTAIDLDKFSFYGDELLASPAEHRACIYDFDNDVLSYPSGGASKQIIVEYFTNFLVNASSTETKTFDLSALSLTSKDYYVEVSFTISDSENMNFLLRNSTDPFIIGGEIDFVNSVSANTIPVYFSGQENFNKTNSINVLLTNNDNVNDALIRNFFVKITEL